MNFLESLARESLFSLSCNIRIRGHSKLKVGKFRANKRKYFVMQCVIWLCNSLPHDCEGGETSETPSFLACSRIRHASGYVVVLGTYHLADPHRNTLLGYSSLIICGWLGIAFFSPTTPSPPLYCILGCSWLKQWQPVVSNKREERSHLRTREKMGK